MYRVRQVGWRLAAAIRPVHDDAIAGILTPELLALFRRMAHGDQTHSLRVLQSLRAAGHDQPDLLVAALLHDCGKARYHYTLFDRVLVVVAKRIAPGWYGRRSQGAARGLLRAVAIAEQHPSWSAEDMVAAGASPLACALARRHADHVEGEAVSEEDRLLRLLQAVDDAS